jgi:hypothetical protein
MTAEQYRSAPGVNFSSLRHILRSPYFYQRALASECEETIDMRLGTMVHGYWLEGKSPQYVVKPEGMSFASKEGKAWKAAQTLPILTQEEAARESRMCTALSGDPVAVRSLAKCPQRERCIFFQYRGVDCKARLDACGSIDGRWTILDLKKTMDARPAAWGKTAIDRDYCFQAAFYRAALAFAEGLDYAPDFYWQVIEDSDAPTVVHYPLIPVRSGVQDETGARIGQSRMDAAFNLLIECQQSGKWPGYGSYLEPIWPAWAERQIAS